MITLNHNFAHTFDVVLVHTHSLVNFRHQPILGTFWFYVTSMASHDDLRAPPSMLSLYACMGYITAPGFSQNLYILIRNISPKRGPIRRDIILHFVQRLPTSQFGLGYPKSTTRLPSKYSRKSPEGARIAVIFDYHITSSLSSTTHLVTFSTMVGSIFS